MTMRSRLFALSLIAGTLLPSFALAASAGPTKVSGALPYERGDDEFTSAIVMDAATRAVLYEYRADVKHPAASLTKLMGALVFLDQRPKWDAIVSLKSSDEVGGGRLRVASGATLSVMDLFFSSIAASANNAAVAMARVSGLGVSGFVRAMNQKANALGLAHTTFTGPSGIEPTNITTARDMAKLALAAFNADAIRRCATTAKYRFKIRNTGEIKEIRSTDDLLTLSAHDDVYVTGGKTGFLYESRYNFVVKLRPSEDKESGRTLLVAVLGVPARAASFASAKALARWAWKAYRWDSK